MGLHVGVGNGKEREGASKRLKKRRGVNRQVDRYTLSVFHLANAAGGFEARSTLRTVMSRLFGSEWGRRRGSKKDK